MLDAIVRDPPGPADLLARARADLDASPTCRSDGATAGVGCALSLENDPSTPPLPSDLEGQIQVTSTGGSS